MQVLLIQPPIQDFYRTEFREYPLGLLYVAAAFQRQGHSARILDARKCKKPKNIPLSQELSYLKSYYTSENDLFLNFKHFGMSYEDIADEAALSKPDIVGISSMFTPYVNEVIQTARHIKEKLPHTRITVGGHHATVDPKSLFSSGYIDEVVQGEGDVGIDILPARDLIAPDKYRLGKKRYAMVLTSRGCPYNCSFCSIHSVSGSIHRTRDIEAVLAEIEECVQRYDIEAIDLQDDNLLFDKDRIKVLFEKILLDPKLRHVEFLASNGLNVSLLDDELLRLMKAIGFKKLDLALGTGEVASRKDLKRPESIANYEHILKLATNMGLGVTTYIILGLPAQPISEMRETVEYLKSKNTLIAPSIFYNVPGMPMFEEAKKFEYSHAHICRRSSAFNSFGNDFTRDDIFELFKEIRRYNLSKQTPY